MIIKKKEDIKNIEHAWNVIQKLKKKVDKKFKEKRALAARYYDLAFAGAKEPDHAELKEQVIYLEQQVQLLTNERDNLKLKLIDLRSEKGETK